MIILIKSQKNILFLPAKNYESLYEYLYYFDITIIPFKLSNMIQSCDPCKFYEYISMGKPVLATKMQPLERFSNICSFIDIDNYDNVIQYEISQLNNKNLIETRKKIAVNNSWYSRSVDLYQFIIEHLT
jgi:hypothetical protein